MADVEIGRHRMDTRAILHDPRNAFGERSLTPTRALRTDFDFGLIFRDQEAQFWEVVNLMSNGATEWHLFPDLTTTALSSEWQGNSNVWLVAEFQRLPWMAFLTPRGTTCLLTLTFGYPGRVFAGRMV